MKKTRTLFFLTIFPILLHACGDVPPPVTGTGSNSWEKVLGEQAGLLGHRNWVVVADAAYPLQSSDGILTIMSDEDHITTVEKTYELLSRQPHVRPVIYLDRESDFLSEAMAPGIAAYREDIGKLLEGEDVHRDLHEDIIRRLDETAKLYNILIIKTDFTVPYTTVFFQLDCAYWGPEDEADLREQMKQE